MIGVASLSFANEFGYGNMKYPTSSEFLFNCCSVAKEAFTSAFLLHLWQF